MDIIETGWERQGEIEDVVNGSSDDDDDQETGEDEKESVTTSSIGEERLNTDTDNIFVFTNIKRKNVHILIHKFSIKIHPT